MVNIDEAKAAIGKLVISRDPGDKMVPWSPPHGPYKLLQVTRAGLGILEGREEYRVPPMLLSLYQCNCPECRRGH